MKCRCPACGRTTVVPPEMLHFLTRCDRCSTLLKPFINKELDNSAGPEIGARVATPGRYREDKFVPRLPLAEILIRRPKPPEPEQQEVVTAPPATPHQKALRRAQLRGNHQMLGTLTMVGGVTLATMTLVVVGLKCMPFVRPAHAEIVHMHDPPAPSHALFTR